MAQDSDWLPSRMWLIDRSTDLAREWQTAFATFPEVECRAGEYFSQEADAMVSPANSFGVMDGGIDLAIRDQLGFSLQGTVQEAIVEQYHGELPVGAAVIVETGNPRWKYLIAAPTMRVPERVATTLNAYLACRALLLAVERFNRHGGAKLIDSLVCCGLATGVGEMLPARCARQMALAYKSMLLPAMIGRHESIHAQHVALRNA